METHQPAQNKSSVKFRFGTAIRTFRNRLGISQEELAWRAGLHRTYLSDVERGARNPSLGSIEKLARALEAPMSALFADAALLSAPTSRNGTDESGDIKDCVEILLVEDNPDDVELTLQAFRAARLKNPIHVVTDGAAAIEFLFSKGAYAGRDPGGKSLIVLLDLNLPKLSGLEVLRIIKRDVQTQRIPVIVLTVSQNDRDFEECQTLGAFHYITKPVDFRDFSHVAPQLRLDWALLRHPPNSVV